MPLTPTDLGNNLTLWLGVASNGTYTRVHAPDLATYGLCTQYTLYVGIIRAWLHPGEALCDWGLAHAAVFGTQRAKCVLWQGISSAAKEGDPSLELDINLSLGSTIPKVVQCTEYSEVGSDQVGTYPDGV